MSGPRVRAEVRTRVRSDRDQMGVESAGKPLRVMLVDDHDVVRKGLRWFLDNEDDITVVAEADSGRRAVELARMWTPDIIVMDVRMADGTGIEACREIRNEHPQTQVIILTTFPDDEALFSAIMAGAAGFVLKDVQGQAMLTTIRSVAAGQSMLDPQVTKQVFEQIRKTKASEKDPKLSRLTSQEDRILVLLCDGLTNPEIAECMHLSRRTVKNYVSSIFQKLDVSRRAEAVAYFTRAQAEHPHSEGA